MSKQNGAGKRGDDSPPPAAPSEIPTPLQQAIQVRAAMAEERSQFVENSQWYVICAKWWESWKAYTQYDKAEEMKVEELSLEDGQPVDPGPMDNSSLTGDRADVLKKGMTEKEHYVFVPLAVYELLRLWYGGGPTFCRDAITVGEGSHAIVQIELYPLEFKVYQSDPQGEPDPSTEFLILFGKKTLAKEIRQQLCTQFKLVPEEVRVWVKTEVDDSEMRDENEDPEETWKMVDENDLNESLEQLRLHSGMKLLLLLEVKTAGCFPRSRSVSADELMESEPPENWKDQLKVGDLVDAMDSDQKWFESVIIEIKGTKAKVHFKGWSSKWDSYLDIQSASIQYLHTKTPKWRIFQEGDEIEIRSEGEPPRWYDGKVLQVDKKAQKIHVKASSEKGFTRWVEINGEEICPSGTHIKKKAITSQGQVTPSKRLSNGAISHGVAGGTGGGARTSTYNGWYGRGNTSGNPPMKGAVGLSNLGNTCFMNSMLQCLSNTSLLTHYFLKDMHEQELNRENPLGTGGKLANAYGRLMKEMWSGNYTVVVPSEFKQTIGQFAPQFAGYQQQDSQELMSFLLDGLHEDLNRVRKKPYVETVESKGRPDTEVAQEVWSKYLSRNNSIVVDHFQGLLKSHVTCPQCNFESVTFDPYLSLSLPLPVPNAHNRDIESIFFPLPLGSKPHKVVMTVPTNGIVRTLKEWIASRFENVEPDRVQVCDVWNHRVFRVLPAASPLTEAIRTSDIIMMYETEAAVLPAPRQTSSVGLARFNPMTALAPKAETGASVLEVLLGKRVKQASAFTGVYKPPLRFDLYGNPYALTFSNDTTNQDIYRAVSKVLSRFLQADRISNEMDTDTAPKKALLDKAAEYPFFLHVTDKTGGSTDGQLRCNDDRFSLSPNRALTVEIIEEIYERAVDENEMGAFQIHSSVQESKEVHAAGKKGIQIQECFQMFIEREQLGENDPWYCSSCKKHQQAYKKFDLWSTPDILILQLKRFLYLPGTYFVHRQKIDEVVDFPVDGLDLSELMLGPNFDEAPPLYDLYAVSEHSGGLGGGHYTAVAKNFEDGKWYNFNDSSVHLTDSKSSITGRAYVLFYKRRQGSLKWAGMTS